MQPILQAGLAEFFQGEVNETNARREGFLTTAANGGKLVTRGACICLYVPRPASQGGDLYLDVPKFLHGKGEDTKAETPTKADEGSVSKSPAPKHKVPGPKHKGGKGSKKSKK